jgi:hypothetical protein
VSFDPGDSNGAPLLRKAGDQLEDLNGVALAGGAMALVESGWITRERWLVVLNHRRASSMAVHTITAYLVSELFTQITIAISSRKGLDALPTRIKGRFTAPAPETKQT